MVEYNPRLDGATLQGGGLVTQEVFDRIMRKNGRARKRMGRRMMRKRTEQLRREIGANAAQCREYTPLEFELANHIGRGRSAKSNRTHAKRVKDIDKSIEAQWRTGNYPWMREKPCAVPLASCQTVDSEGGAICGANVSLVGEEFHCDKGHVWSLRTVPERKEAK